MQLEGGYKIPLWGYLSGYGQVSGHIWHCWLGMLPKRPWDFWVQDPEEEGRQTARTAPQAWRSAGAVSSQSKVTFKADRSLSCCWWKCSDSLPQPFPDAFRKLNLFCLGTEQVVWVRGRLTCLSWQPVTCLRTYEHTRSFISAPEKFHQSLAEAKLQIEQIFARVQSQWTEVTFGKLKFICYVTSKKRLATNNVKKILNIRTGLL